MKKKIRSSLSFTVGILLACSTLLSAQQLAPVKLLKPQTDIGKPLMQALMARQTAREFSEKPLALQELSNLLWAAWVSIVPIRASARLPPRKTVRKWKCTRSPKTPYISITHRNIP